MEKKKIDILMIESESNEAVRIKEMLSEARHEEFSVHQARNLGEGLSRMESRNFGAVLVDLELPDSHGLETALAVRNRSEQTPVVILTNLEDEKAAQESLEMGIQDYLVKSEISSTLLIRSIRYAIQRKQGEVTLRLSEGRYRTLYCDNPTMIFTLNAEGTILSANPICTQLGYSIEELEGKSALEVFHEDDRAAVADQLRTCLQNPDQVFHWQFRKIRKNGELMWVEETAQAVPDLSGSLNVMVVCQDMTERKRAGTALQESEERFRATFNQAAVGIAHVGPDGRLLRINQKYCDIVGYTADELSKLTMMEITHPEDQETGGELFRRMLEGKLRSYSLEKRYVRKNGTIIWVNLTVSTVVNAGGHLRFAVGVIQDITERKQMEQQIEKLNQNLTARVSELEDSNQELEAFNRMVSHDLRQPLNTIGLSCQTIEMHCGNRLDVDCANYLRAISNGIFRMNDLIEALLTFARSTHGELKRETVNLSEIAKDVVAETRLSEPERRVRFHLVEGMMAYGDPNLLRSVLENLIGNAWKYASLREETVIEFGSTQIDGKAAYFIRDNGKGFDMADAARIFTPFQRLSDTESCRGFGIGLATVERVIRRHGGQVWAKGEPDKGATFYFTLPTQNAAT